MSPLEGRVHHIDYMLVHLSYMHRDEKLVPSPEVYYTDWKKIENEERGWRETDCQNKIESIKCEVVKLDLLEQVLNFKSGKGMSAQPLMEALTVYVPHKEK